MVTEVNSIAEAEDKLIIELMKGFTLQPRWSWGGIGMIKEVGKIPRSPDENTLGIPADRVEQIEERQKQ